MEAQTDSTSKSPVYGWMKRLVLIQKSKEPKEIPLDEIFESIGGEGPTYGLPTIFIRVAGCSRTCSWCDSGYKEFPDATRSGIHTVYFSVEHLFELIKNWREIKKRHICFTGGEPYLFIDKLMLIMDRFCPGFGYSIETNGELIKDLSLLYRIKNLTWVVSPKLSSSGKKSPINDNLTLFSNVYFKFVVGNKEDIKEVEQIVSKIRFVNPVFIQPVYGYESAVDDIFNSGLLMENSGEPLFLTNVPSSEKAGELSGSYQRAPVPSGTSAFSLGPAFPIGNQVRFSFQVHKMLNLP